MPSGGTGGSDGVGGSTSIAGGGSGVAGAAGAIDSGAGGGVSSAGSGSAGAPPNPNCDDVTCPSIPSSCKRLVQGPSDCCPTCTDTGCEPCFPVDCPPGTHHETAAGACCAACVPDPPAACTLGQQEYQVLHDLLLRGSSALACKNSSDCHLVTEDNACVYVCNVPISTIYEPSFVDDLTKNAPQLCSTCDPPARPDCKQQAAACLNGTCVRADVADP